MISVVILTFNSMHFISLCLDSLLRQDSGEIEIIVVDNSSCDGTGDFVRDNYPQVKLIKNSSNEGAAKARNQGIEAAKGEWILTLDCDVAVNGDFFRKARSFLSGAGSCVGSVQPKILDAQGAHIYSTGIAISFLKRFRDVGMGRNVRSGYNRIASRFGSCSAAAFYRKDMLEKVKEDSGYFDERFFFLFEDVDLSWRCRKKGYKTVFFPDAVCRHHGDSSHTGKKTRQYLCLRNRYYTLLKNDSMANCIIPFLFYDLPRLLWIMLTNRFSLRAVGEAIRYGDGLARGR